jgi:hypothetical protein
MKLQLSCFILMITSLCACGSDPGNGSGGSNGTGSTSSSTASTGGATGAALCPATEPTGGSCDAPDGRHCTYGDSVGPECRTDWSCKAGAWVKAASICFTPPADHCAFTEPPTGPCANVPDTCIVGAATICNCATCTGPCDPTPYAWSCWPAPTTTGCPAIVPNDGTACSTEGTRCVYGNACQQSGANATCTDGAWLWEQDVFCG